MLRCLTRAMAFSFAPELPLAQAVLDAVKRYSTFKYMGKVIGVSRRFMCTVDTQISQT